MEDYVYVVTIGDEPPKVMLSLEWALGYLFAQSCLNTSPFTLERKVSG